MNKAPVLLLFLLIITGTVLQNLLPKTLKCRPKCLKWWSKEFS